MASMTVRAIIQAGRPILRVSHQIDDGCWQFFNAKRRKKEDARVVRLAEMVGLDPTIAALADLPLPWRALRRSRDEPCVREPNPHETA